MGGRFVIALVLLGLASAIGHGQQHEECRAHAGESHVCHEHSSAKESGDLGSKALSEHHKGEVWAKTIAATVVVGAAPVVILCFIPIEAAAEAHEKSPLMRNLLSFAAGGLLGDAFLHLLPHTMEDAYAHRHHHHDHHHRASSHSYHHHNQEGGHHERSHHHDHEHDQMEGHHHDTSHHLEHGVHNYHEEDDRHGGDDPHKKAQKHHKEQHTTEHEIHEHAGHGHGHDHDDHHHKHGLEDMAPWLFTLSGFLTFLMIDKYVRTRETATERCTRASADDTSEQPMELLDKSIDGTETDSQYGLRKRKVAQSAVKPTSETDAKTENARSKEIQLKVSTQGGHNHVAAAGFLNLVADFAHNFTDGLALGSTFSQGIGLQTTVAILLHEVPHEVGDFAILVQSGFQRKTAMLLQLVTAAGCMLGAIIALIVEEQEGLTSKWITPFTAGGFIYIAAVTVLPEVLGGCSARQSMVEFMWTLMGVLLMVLIVFLE